MAEAFSAGENHGNLTFRSNAQAVAACVVVSAAPGTVAAPPGQLPAAVHYVHYDVLRGPTVYTWNDAPAEERREALPTQAAPPRSDWPPLTKAGVRSLIDHAVGQPPHVAPSQVGPPTREPTADTTGHALRPLLAGPPPPARPAEQPTPPSRGPDPPQPNRQEAAPELQQRRPVAPADSPKSKMAGADGRGSRLCRR